MNIVTKYILNPTGAGLFIRADAGRLHTVIDDIDIYRAAQLYVDQHGDQAALQAAMQSDALLDAGDLTGAATWRKIIKAIEVMQATEPIGAPQ